jgi:hypothetical protein
VKHGLYAGAGVADEVGAEQNAACEASLDQRIAQRKTRP